jgi:hypothetical protein
MKGGTAGKTYFKYPEISVEECKVMCDEDKACLGYEHQSGRKLCEIHIIAVPKTHTKGSCAKYQCFSKEFSTWLSSENDDHSLVQGTTGNANHLIARPKLVSDSFANELDATNKSQLKATAIATVWIVVGVGFISVLVLLITVRLSRSSPRLPFGDTYTGSSTVATDLDFSWDPLDSIDNPDPNPNSDPNSSKPGHSGRAARLRDPTPEVLPHRKRAMFV